MSTTILADNGASSGSSGLKVTGDASGVLALQTTTSGGTATTALSISSSQVVSFTNNPTYSGGTANGVAYLNGSNVLTTGSALVFDGTNLGLGVTPPSFASGTKGISVLGTGNNVWAYSASDYYLTQNAYFGSGWTYASTAAASTYRQSGGVHYWNVAASGTAGSAISFTQAMTLNASGYLGIGTSSPGSALDVIGTGRINASASSSATGTLYIKGAQSDSSGLVLTFNNSSNAATINNYYSGVLQFGTSNTTQATLDSSGNLGLGVTPSAWSGGFKAFELAYGALASNGNGDTRIYAASYFGSSGNTYSVTGKAAGLYNINSGNHYWYNAPSGTVGNAVAFTQAMTLSTDGTLFLGGATSDLAGSSYDYLVVPVANGGRTGIGIQNSGGNSNTAAMRFTTTSGNAGTITFVGTTTSYNTSSDQRLKTNIVDAPEGNVDAIKVRSFDWISDGSHQTYGMVAQELLEVAPYAVSQPADPEEMMGVDYSKLVPMLVKEIQSLRARVAQLESKGA